MTTKTTDVPRPHSDIRTRPSMKVGLAICGLLAVLDVAGLTGFGSEDAPSAAGPIPGGALGLITLAAIPAARRGRPAAITAVVLSRVLSALGGVAAFLGRRRTRVGSAGRCPGPGHDRSRSGVIFAGSRDSRA